MSGAPPSQVTDARLRPARPVDGTSLLAVGGALIDAASCDHTLGLALTRSRSGSGEDGWHVATRLATQPGQREPDVRFGAGAPLEALAYDVARGTFGRWIASVRARLSAGLLHLVRTAALDTPALLRMRLAMELAGARRLAGTPTGPAGGPDPALRLVFADAEADAPKLRGRHRHRPH